MGLERSEEEFVCGYGARCNQGDIVHGTVNRAGKIDGAINFTDTMHGTANGTGWCIV